MDRPIVRPIDRPQKLQFLAGIPRRHFGQHAAPPTVTYITEG